MALATTLAGYLVGSVSFAVLITRARGVDIFTIGSGNPGATNVLRALGKPYGYACFLLDALKGVAGVLIGKSLALQTGLDPQLLGICGLIGAIVGHSYSLFLRFKGGKGVAVTIGGLFALLPAVMLIGVILWVVTFYIWKYVSVSSMILGISLPVSALILGRSGLDLGLCLLLAILILFRHRTNLQRLMAGTENRAGKIKNDK